MNPDEHLNASSRIMVAEATKRGYKTTLFGDNETVLLEKNGQSFYIRGSRTSFQSSVGKTIADYKPLTKKVLTHFGLPTAKSVLVKNSDELTLLADFTYQVVMKPVADRHGKGVVVGIKSATEAKQEFEKANQSMLFEETLQGTEFRIVCVDYKFLAAAFRKPAHIVGDGKSTIQELIDKKNQHPWRGEGHSNNLSLIKVDEHVLTLLAADEFTLASVPNQGMEVYLRKTANLSTGGEAWDVTEEVCQENRELFEQIARVCDLNVAGIDMMCETLKSPITLQDQAGVIEVNASPGLRMHHFPIQGRAINVAEKILELAEKKLKE